MKLSIRIAWMFMLRRNSWLPTFSTLVSILGVAFGVAGFIVVVTVTNSVQRKLKELILSANPHLAIYNVPEGIPNARYKAQILRQQITEPIQAWGLFEYSQGIVSKGYRTSTVVIRGIEGNNSANADDFKQIIEPKGAFAKLNTSAFDNNTSEQKEMVAAVIGRGLALRLDAKVGDEIALIAAGYDGEQKASPVKIAGILSLGLADYDDRLLVLNFDNAVHIFGREGWARGIEYKLKNMDDAAFIAERLQPNTPYLVRAWQQLDRPLFMQIERDGMSIRLIVGIITLVATFNILATLSLNVLDKQKHIALLRSVGATKNLLLRVFVFMGVTFGIIGSFLGVGLGLVILRVFSGIELGELKATYFLDSIPVYYDFGFIMQTAIAAICLSFVSSLYPAWRAMRVSPLFGMQQGIM